MYPATLPHRWAPSIQRHSPEFITQTVLLPERFRVDCAFGGGVVLPLSPVCGSDYNARTVVPASRNVRLRLLSQGALLGVQGVIRPVFFYDQSADDCRESLIQYNAVKHGVNGEYGVKTMR